MRSGGCGWLAAPPARLSARGGFWPVWCSGLWVVFCVFCGFFGVFRLCRRWVSGIISGGFSGSSGGVGDVVCVGSAAVRFAHGVGAEAVRGPGLAAGALGVAGCAGVAVVPGLGGCRVGCFAVAGCGRSRIGCCVGRWPSRAAVCWVRSIWRVSRRCLRVRRGRGSVAGRGCWRRPRPGVGPSVRWAVRACGRGIGRPLGAAGSTLCRVVGCASVYGCWRK